MISLRMCMVCRKRKEKGKLMRISCDKAGWIALDPQNKNGGRGAYICRDVDCVMKAQKKRALERAFGSPVDERIYTELCQMAGEADE